MNIELSPSQERRLHLILDKGLVALHEHKNVENESNKPATDLDLTFSSQVSNLSHTSNASHGSQDSHISKSSQAETRPQARSELCELQFLRAKLAELESKVQKKPAKVLFKKISPPLTTFSKTKSSNSGRTSDRPSSVSKDRVKSIEKIKDAEKAIGRLERSITASPSRKISTGNRANVEVLIEQERKSGDRLRKENEMLRKELAKKDELMALVSKLQDEYAELATSFEKSEQIRKKQKVLIEQLKLEIKTMNVENGDLHKKKKIRKTCKNL